MKRCASLRREVLTPATLFILRPPSISTACAVFSSAWDEVSVEKESCCVSFLFFGVILIYSTSRNNNANKIGWNSYFNIPPRFVLLLFDWINRETGQGTALYPYSSGHRLLSWPKTYAPYRQKKEKNCISTRSTCFLSHFPSSCVSFCFLYVPTAWIWVQSIHERY